MNVAERSKLWLEAKAHAELDGFMLPQEFIDFAQEYIKGSAKLKDLVDFYRSLLPEEEMLREMYKQYDPGYLDLNINEPLSLDALLSNNAKPEMVHKGLTVKNIMGMTIALNYLSKHAEEVARDV